MSSQIIEQRFRLFLLGLSAFIFAGAVVELWFAEHTGSLTQLIPFVLAASGVVVVGLALFWPRRLVLLLLRGATALIFLGSLFGIYEHVEHNLTFELEIRPNAGVTEVFLDALGGASPLLAPGILTLAALLALAATYYHPVLTPRE